MSKKIVLILAAAVGAAAGADWIVDGAPKTRRSPGTALNIANIGAIASFTA